MFLMDNSISDRVCVLHKLINMTVTTNERGVQNLFATEPQMYTKEITVTHNEKAEMLNGRVAMLGVIAALGAYALTGQIIPGIW